MSDFDDLDPQTESLFQASLDSVPEELLPEPPSGLASVEELKELLASHLVTEDRMKEPDGLPTGLNAFDNFLFWKGVPKGALTLFQGPLGAGATSLWLEAARQVTKDKKWVAWVQSGVPLSPLPLAQSGLDLGHLICFELKQDVKKLLWLLQELMSSSLFELIGCDLGCGGASSWAGTGARQSWPLKEHQVRQLQAQARQSQIALVFLSTPREQRALKGSIASVFSLIVNFEKNHLRIERALHRPTPRLFARSSQYARFTFHSRDRVGSGSHQPHAVPSANHRTAQPSSLFEAAGVADRRFPAHASRADARL